MLPGTQMLKFWCRKRPAYWGLTFTAEQANSTISMAKNRTPPEVSLKTSTDGKNWTPFVVGETTITLSKVGDKVYFAAGEGGNTRFASTVRNYNYFVMSGLISASGSINSLLNAETETTTLPDTYTFCRLFSGCTGLTTAPALPATTLALSCYRYMFYNCTRLTLTPLLPATTIANYCYAYMFYGCTDLAFAHPLPATTLANYCYQYMFYNCTSLVTAPVLPAKKIASRSYQYMFSGCTRLNRVEAFFTNWGGDGTTNWLSGVSASGTLVCLPQIGDSSIIERGASRCPDNWDITTQGIAFIANEAMSTVSMLSSGNAPHISLETSTDGIEWTSFTVGSSTITLENEGDFVCFRSTLSGNASTASSTSDYNHFVMTGDLVAIGDIRYLLSQSLGEVILSERDYAFCGLFRDCTSLSRAPELPYTPLSSYCYAYMFYGCGSLIRAPLLPATTLSTGCYAFMFYGCRSLNHVEVKFTSWLSGATDSWLSNVSGNGSFVCPSALGTDATITRGVSNCPTTWNVYEYWGLCFRAEEANSTISMLANGSAPSVTLKTSTDGENWTPFIVGTTTITLADVGDKVYFAAGEGGNTTFGTSGSKYNRFVMTGKVAASGSVNSLLNAETDAAWLSTSYTYVYLFGYCSSLTSVPDLPSVKLSQVCYANMFHSCTSLVSAPFLPAIELAQACYQGMFYNCSSLVNAPALPAKKVVTYCYQYMFYGCTKLTTAPVLPAVELTTYNGSTSTIPCYDYMFYGCTNLNKVEVYFRNWGTSPVSQIGSTGNWLTNVSATGTFICPPALGDNNTIERGVSRCPSGWDVRPYWGLCFTAEEPGAVVNMVKRDSPPAVELKYSTDGTDWYTFDADGGTTPVTLANVGDKVYFKAGENGNTAFSLVGNSLTTANASNQSRSFTFSKRVSASGDIMSLLDGNKHLDTFSTNYAFRCLFRDCATLTSAPALPAVGLSQGCYANMFSGCSSLVVMPALPATTLKGYCYQDMFYQCTSLNDVQDLPAAKFQGMSYQRMFSNCSALTKAPKLMFTATSVLGAANMFYGCSNLSEIEVRMTSWGSLAFQNWVKDVAATGTFKCPADLGTDETIKRGVSNCPEGWTVVNI